MYSNPKLCIKLSNNSTKLFPSQIRLKQWCNLSPLCLNIFIKDIVEKLKYADDLIVNV